MRRINKIFVPIVISQFFCFETYARAGGGGSGGGGPLSGILLIPLLIFNGVLFLLIKHKVKQNKKLIEEAAKSDSSWNYEWMMNYAKEMFFVVQEAWTKRSTDLIKNNITAQLDKEYSDVFLEMRENHVINVIKNIDIKEIKIIGAKDYIDNHKDCFQAHIKGRLTDYTIDETTDEIIINPIKYSNPFTDIFHFVRSENGWMLDCIENDPSVRQIIFSKTFKEIPKD